MLKVYFVNFGNLLINILLLLIFIRVLLSWIPAGMGKFRVFIYEATEPILMPLRKLIPPVGGVLDLSPIVAFLILTVVQNLINAI